MYAGAPITTMGLPSIGSLLGSSGNQALINNINESLGASAFFGTVRDTMAGLRNVFIENVVAPIKSTAHAIENVIRTVLNPDVIRPLLTLDDFKSIPPSMHLPILTFAPVRKLFEEGRISGFGYNPDYLPPEDMFGRLIDNGTVHDVMANVQEDGTVSFVEEWHSTDLLLTQTELEYIEITRNRIREMMNDTLLDPTDISCERG